MKLEEHPTVQRIHPKAAHAAPSKRQSLDAGWLKFMEKFTFCCEIISSACPYLRPCRGCCRAPVNPSRLTPQR